MCQQQAHSCPPRIMNDIKKRLSRTLSGPRRCTKCQKMVYLSLSRCKYCDELTHKHCAFHSRKNCKSNFQEKTEETNNSILKTDNPEWRILERSGATSPGSCDAEEAYQSELQHPSPSVAMAGILKIVHWLSSHSRKSSRMRNRCNEKHYKGRYGLNLNMDDKEARKMFKMVLKNSRNCQKQMYSSGYCGQYQQQYLNQREVYNQLLRHRKKEELTSPRSSISSRSDSSFLSPASTPEIKNLRQKREKMVKQASIKWDKDVLNPANDPSSNFSLCTDYHPSERSKLNSVSPKPSLRPKEKGWFISGKHEVLFHQKCLLDPKATTISFAKPPCLTKAKTLSIESRDCKNESLCATWPPAGKAGTILEEIVDEAEADCIEEADESFTMSDFRSDSQSGEESLREWYIPFADIEFQERIRHGRQGDIYKGRWYGEVLIYTIRESCGRELNQFLDEVAQMGMIRHENIVLFMGACIEPQRLAVITSMRKGPTLFEYLHLKRHRLPFHSKHNIARQIAQGMGYLHAKDITHKRLNSKNIILECRVKLCIMDHGMADKQLDRCDYGCIPRGQLSYMSPELMSSLKIDPPNIFASKPCTQASDIFAFGSLLYELLSERFAFHDQPPHALIWQVATGKTPPLHNFRFINGLKTLIKRCWSGNPKQRPPFSEIVHILQENISHHRRHSCSEPDRLHLTGQASSRTLCT